MTQISQTHNEMFLIRAKEKLSKAIREPGHSRTEEALIDTLLEIIDLLEHNARA